MKVGDIIGTYHHMGNKGHVVGTYLKGVILAMQDSSEYLVQFDTDIGGHDGEPGWSNVRGKEKHCWYVGADVLELFVPRTERGVALI